MILQIVLLSVFFLLLLNLESFPFVWLLWENAMKIILETKIDIKFSLLQITQIHVYR